jgi:hypothetical protein
MRWKFLGLMNVLIASVAIAGPGEYSVPRLVCFGMAIPAAVGVFLYASEATAAERFWRIFSWLFAAESIGLADFLLRRSIAIWSAHSPVLIVALLAFVFASQFFTWQALHRLGQGLRIPVARRSARDERSAQFLAEAAKDHPKTAKVAAWTLMIAIIAVFPMALWHQISERGVYSLVAPTVAGLVIGLKLYGAQKKARAGK